MNTIEKLKQARNVQDLAHEIEPLAQALASLADETRQSLQAAQREAQRVSELSCEAQDQATRQTQNMLWEIEQAAKQLASRFHEARSLSLSITWRVALIAALTGILSAAATTGLWHWLPQWNAEARVNQQIGENIRYKCRQDPQACDTIWQAMGWEQ